MLLRFCTSLLRSSVCPLVYQLLPQQALQLPWITDSMCSAQTLHRGKIVLLEMHRMSDYKFCIATTWLRQKGHCQNNCFSPRICLVLVLFSCVHLDLMKYSYIYVGCKVHLAICLAVFLLESTCLTWKITSNRVSHRIRDCSIREGTLQSCISVLERNLSLFTHMAPGNSTITAVSAAV